MVTTEMLPTAVLVPMSEGLGVPEAKTAHLVSAWAAVVVLASFPLVRLFRGWDRRLVIVAGMMVLAASSVLTAVAPTYLTAVGARLLGAGAVGLLWATVNAYVADLVSDRLLGTAVAVVLGGATLGMVVGTPVARLIADFAGWRMAFAALAAIGLLVALLVRLVVARAESQQTANVTGDAQQRASLRPLLGTTGLVALVLVGHYAAYTFITRLAEAAAAGLPGRISALLLIFGIASAVGVAVAGRVGVRTRVALVVSVALTAGSLLALTFVDVNPTLGLAIVVIWGVVSGAMPPLAQTEILRQAGRAHRALAGTLIPVLFNGAIAIGAALAALLVDRAGVGALPMPAAAVVAIAAVGLLFTGVARRRDSERGNQISPHSVPVP